MVVSRVVSRSRPLSTGVAGALQLRVSDPDSLALAALSQLALSNGGWAAGNSLAIGHLLLALGDVVKDLGADGLIGMLLGLSGGTSLCWTSLACEPHLGMRNVGDGLTVEVASVGLAWSRIAGIPGLMTCVNMQSTQGGFQVVVASERYKDLGTTYLIGSFGSLTLGQSSRTTSNGDLFVGDVHLALGDVGHDAAVKCLVGMLLGLSRRASLHGARLASKLVLLLGDAGDGLGVKSVGSHFGWCGCVELSVRCD